MKILAIDLETFNGTVDIKKAGGYRYAETCSIMLFGYAYDDEPVQVVDMARGEEIPRFVLSDLLNPDVLKIAFNAQFERTVLTHYLRQQGMLPKDKWLDARQWMCTMVLALTLGLPGNLADLGEALGLSEDEKKMDTGKALIRIFCTNKKYSKKPEEDPERWNLFVEYNRRDVEVERQIRKMLWKYRQSEFEHELWALDQRINDRGVTIDAELARNAIVLNEEVKDEVVAEMREITHLHNPASGPQLKLWIQQNEGLFEPISSLTKETIPDLIASAKREDTKEALRLRQKIGKTSTKKYQAMLDAQCEDGKVRGLLQFYGASRTGRWAGRLVQVQNLPRCYLEDLDDAREMLRSGDRDTFEFCYENISDTLSQLIRTAFTASPGCVLIDADFSAIEARVIAWLADEKWRQDVFAAGGDIYCMSASQMFHCKVEKHGENAHLRQKGKIAELACIAEGQLVLTDHGLIPIEKVTTHDKVWDGENFVQHEGVIYKGVREVIEYDGLTATPDHEVFIGESRTVQFGDAAASGLHLIQAGDGRNPVRACSDYLRGKEMDPGLGQAVCTDKMHRLRKHSVDTSGQPETREVKRLPAMLAEETDSLMAGQETHISETALHEPERPGIRELRSPRDSVQIPVSDSSRAVPDREVRDTEENDGNRPDRRQRGLCSGEYPIRNASGEQPEQAEYDTVEMGPAVLAVQLSCGDQKAGLGVIEGADYSGRKTGGEGEAEKLARYKGKAPVYDIRNAGPHHRYTVSGKLVHNCGYGGGLGAMKAMGADKMGLSDDEISDIVGKWREASPRIVKLWSGMEQAAIRAIRGKCKIPCKHGMAFTYADNCLFMTLPSGRRIAYQSPEIGENRFGGEAITYLGVNQTTRQWTRLETYSGKLVENAVQAIARDCLAVAMSRLDAAGYRIIMHIHDEIVADMPKGKGSLDEAAAIMSQPIDWAPGLLLNADGWVDKYFKKD